MAEIVIEASKVVAMLYIGYILERILREMYAARRDRGYRMMLQVEQAGRELQSFDR